MLENSNTDQRKATALITNPQTPNFSSPSAGFQRPVRRVKSPTPVVMVNMAYNPPVPKASTVATAPSFNPNINPSPASTTTQITALRGVLAVVTWLSTAGIFPSRAIEYTMRDVYCTTDAPHARNAVMTTAKKGFSAHSPKLSMITGVIGSDVALVLNSVSRSKLNVRAAELKSTTLPTMQREKNIARGTMRLGSWVSSAMVEQASKPMKAQPAMASAARNAAVWLGADPVPRCSNNSENPCCRKKRNSSSATPKDPTISA